MYNDRVGAIKSTQWACTIELSGHLWLLSPLPHFTALTQLRLISFETTCYRWALCTSWPQNKEVDSEGDGNREAVDHNHKKPKLKYFGCVIQAQNLYTHILKKDINSRRLRGKSRQHWANDVRDWTGRMLVECTIIVREGRVLVQLFPTLNNVDWIKSKAKTFLSLLKISSKVLTIIFNNFILMNRITKKEWKLFTL